MSELKDRRYVRKLPDAYKKTVESNNNKLLQIDEAAVDNLYTDIAEVVSVLDLDNANGKILDDYGEMLGVYRGELNDRQYRAVIKANIAANISKSDYMSVMRGLDYIFGKGIMSISEVADSIATVRLADTTYENLRETGLNADQIKELTKKLIAIGVQIEASNFWGTFEFGDILTLGSNTLSGKAVSIPDDESTFTELESITLYGKSTQDGTPTPEAPVDIVSVGDSGFDIISKGDDDFTLISCRNNNSIITKQPVSAVRKIGETANFTVTATGTNLTYQWWQDVNNGNGWVVINTTSARKSTFSIAGATFRNGYKYRCVVTSDEGSCISNVATLYVVSDNSNVKSDSMILQTNLCGIPVTSDGNYTDSTGQQWVCDELIYNADGSGKIIKRIGKVVYDGSDDEGWKKSAATLRFYGNKITDIYAYEGNKKLSIVICNRYASRTDYETIYTKLTGITLGSNSDLIIYDADRTDWTVNEWKAWLAENPITAIYKLAEPQEISLSTDEMAALRELQTYSGGTNISNSGGADMTVSYEIKGMEYDEAKGWGNIEQTIGGFFGTVVKGITDVRTRKPLIYVKPPNTRIVYNKPAEITLSSKTYGARIYYTTDGTDPTDKSTLYTEPFILYSGDYTGVNKTVKAIAYSDDLAPSSISEKVITWKPALIGTFEFSSITPEYDANKGFGNIQQTIGGYVGDVIDNIQWEE